MGSTTVKVGPLARTFEAIGLPDIVAKPVKGDGWVQLHADRRRAHGRARPAPGAPRPFVQWQAPLVWTTLSLTIHADGTVEGAMTGAQPLPAPLGLRRRAGA